MRINKPTGEQKNNPNRAGERASCMVIFGEFHRYACFASHTRFDSLSWVVVDAEIPDEITGRPTIIRQASSFEEAIQGLGA